MQNLKELPVLPLMISLANNDSKALVEIESSLDIARAMESTSIRKLDSFVGKKNIVKAISYLILRMSENFNMNGKFNDVQAAILANDLYEIFGYETLEDVVLMFKLARQGKIGDGRDFKLDGQTVLHKWVPSYLELKAIERENQHQRQKDSQKPANRPLNPMILASAGKEKVEYEKGGLGTRQKEKLEVKGNSPIQKRSVYLELMAEKIKGLKTDDLEIALKSLERENELDTAEVVRNEIKNRK